MYYVYMYYYCCYSRYYVYVKQLTANNKLSQMATGCLLRCWPAHFREVTQLVVSQDAPSLMYIYIYIYIYTNATDAARRLPGKHYYYCCCYY